MKDGYGVFAPIWRYQRPFFVAFDQRQNSKIRQGVVHGVSKRDYVKWKGMEVEFVSNLGYNCRIKTKDEPFIQQNPYQFFYVRSSYAEKKNLIIMVKTAERSR